MTKVRVPVPFWFISRKEDLVTDAGKPRLKEGFQVFCLPGSSDCLIFSFEKDAAAFVSSLQLENEATVQKASDEREIRELAIRAGRFVLDFNTDWKTVISRDDFLRGLGESRTEA